MAVSMEARMARIEGMMEALVQDRGITIPSREIVDQIHPPSDGFSGSDSNFDPALLTLGQPLGPLHSAPGPHSAQPMPNQTEEGPDTKTVHAGGRCYAFPNLPDYREYLDSFFEYVVSFHPCIDEEKFRAGSLRALYTSSTLDSEINTLGLHFIAFACVDIIVSKRPRVAKRSTPEGWKWCEDYVTRLVPLDKVPELSLIHI